MKAVPRIIPRWYARDPVTVLMDGEITPIAEDDRVYVQAFPVKTDKANLS